MSIALGTRLGPYEVTAQIFLMMQARIDPADPLAGLTQIVVVQNWLEERKQRVPTR
jgi:hypothetical protein